MKNKKSQITVFIIIGIILLFSTALVLYIKSQVAVPEKEVRVAVERVPTEAQPVQAFIIEALREAGEDALNNIGLHGGYVSVDSREYSGFDFQKDDEHPTEADMVDFPPGADNYVPYWEYMRPPDDCEVCQLGSWRPPLYRAEGGNSIESQIDKHLEKSIRQYLDNFKEFRDSGYSIEEAGGINVTTYVRENDVLIYMRYPIMVSVEGSESIRMSEYQITLPVRMSKVYRMAEHIIETSARSRFLGLNTLNLISGFSRVDEDALPPFYQLRFSYDSVSWSKKNVKNLLKQMLQAYVPALQVEGTSNFNSPARFEDPLMQGLYRGMVVPGEEVTDLSVGFMYLGWPLYLNFVGSESDTLKPTKMEIPPFLNLIPFKDYKFVYDISYPVIVRVSDPEAYSGRGYTFVFAMETNIRNNDAVSNNFVTIPAVSADLSQQSTFCEEKQRNSGPITIKAVDAETGEPLEGVNVIFRSSQRCSIGRTELDDDVFSENFETAVLEERFPVGIGTLILSKPEYKTKYVRFATALNKSQEGTFELHPMKRVKAVMKKKKAESLGVSLPIDLPTVNTGMLGSPVELSESDIVILNVNKVQEETDEEPVTSAVTFMKGINETWQNITLVPGRYEVIITLIHNETVIIPEDEVCEGGFAGVGEECVELPELEFENYIFPTTEYEWEVTQEELSGATEAEFFVIYADLPEDHKDLERIEDKFAPFKNNMNFPYYKPLLK